jgi:hypothetical protein
LVEPTAVPFNRRAVRITNYKLQITNPSQN